MCDNTAFCFPIFSSPTVHIPVSYTELVTLISILVAAALLSSTATLVVTAVAATSGTPVLVPVHDCARALKLKTNKSVYRQRQGAVQN